MLLSVASLLHTVTLAVDLPDQDHDPRFGQLIGTEVITSTIDPDTGIIYVGGDFSGWTRADATTAVRGNLAAFDRDGNLLEWAPTTSNDPAFRFSLHPGHIGGGHEWKPTDLHGRSRCCRGRPLHHDRDQPRQSLRRRADALTISGPSGRFFAPGSGTSNGSCGGGNAAALLLLLACTLTRRRR